ncbi:MAG: hypothetical protein COT59_00100 [Candidatus Nealsonbacteria bacterium CG09_land_8_20_14_0_10_42_14]|uniref:PEGA domain-containing protein n=1 Tax=Candidatus Nealsonbacteria bacterium CG09_land_8_20_14_0_10_42_14 TaxID=1974707 RepID=A0A2H0WY54_9BACT|nr:MAG: hypothetical protein COT59_00100 [Candidatus Nealsonbacteria bacterium CG09_land_8_20_14_0_10_42_14]
MVRNLSYDDVGTVGGIPAGTILETENITRNNIDYTVKTTVVYIDDSFDGLAPTDALSSDYKRVKVRVWWSGRFGGEVNLVTDVVPKGVESEAGGGTLQISVFDASGLGVALASLHVVNIEVLPTIDAWYQTDIYGDLVLVGAPLAVEAYQITASKSTYSTERTYGVEEIANPSKPHTSVYEGQLTEISFSIDRLANFSIQTTGTRGQGYPPIKDIPFTLQGAKIIGTDAEENPAYKYFEIFLTGSAGKLDMENLEWDSYTFSVDKAVTGLDLIEVESPFGATTTQPIDLLPNSTEEVRLILKAENSLLLTIKDSTTLLPIFAASCQVGEEQRPTDENGQAFFIPLTPATYNLEISAAGYQTYTGTIGVSGDTTLTVNLIKLP